MKPTTSTPPRWATWLLKTLGDPNRAEEVQGDLLELYAYWRQTVGKRKARWRYGLSVLKLVRPLAKLKRTSTEYPQPFLLSPDMVRNYLKIAWRNLAHSKTFALINGFGLTLGVTCAMLVFVVVQHETGYDRHHKNANRLYRVETENIADRHPHPGTYTELATALRNEAPELETVVPIWHEWERGLSIPASGKFFKESINFADGSLFRLLDYEWVAGDARIALSQPNQVVLTEASAQKFYGSTDVIGKTIRYDDKQDLQVTGVLKNHPVTTNFPFDVLISFATLKRVNPDYDSHGWSGFGDNFQVYTLLKKGTTPEQLTRRFHAIQVKYQKDPKTVQHQRFVLNPLAKLHYGYNFSGRQANPKLLNILSLTYWGICAADCLYQFH